MCVCVCVYVCVCITLWFKVTSCKGIRAPDRQAGCVLARDHTEVGSLILAVNGRQRTVQVQSAAAAGVRADRTVARYGWRLYILYSCRFYHDKKEDDCFGHGVGGDDGGIVVVVVDNAVAVFAAVVCIMPWLGCW